MKCDRCGGDVSPVKFDNYKIKDMGGKTWNAVGRELVCSDCYKVFGAYLSLPQDFFGCYEERMPVCQKTPS
jgi:hypothetical protein